MLSFYPGPSQIYPQVKVFMADAYESGILSVNHRSTEFVAMCRRTVELMKEKLGIPPHYTILFSSSATECWEIISESFIDVTSLHVYNGAFGEKWGQYRQKISPNVLQFPFAPSRMLSLNKLRVSKESAGVVCLTQNETSNGTQLKNRLLKKVRNTFPNSIIAIDATSSMAGIDLDWLSADLWYASVQKCFGLPAGLAVMIVSPRAVEKALKVGHNLHYNSLVFQLEKMQGFQTTYTPNVLTMYLLMRVMEMVPPIRKQARHLKIRATDMRSFLQKNGYELLYGNQQIASDTVLVVKGTPENVTSIKQGAKKAGLLLGNGYGTWKTNSFRIANFPALTDANFEQLKKYLKR